METHSLKHVLRVRHWAISALFRLLHAILRKPSEVYQLLWAHIKNKETKAERMREGKVCVAGRGGCDQGPPFVSSIVLGCSSPLHHSTAWACTRQWSVEVRMWALDSDSGFISQFHPWLCDLCKLSINYLSLFLLLPLFYPIAPGHKLFLPGSQVWRDLPAIARHSEDLVRKVLG